MDWDQMIIELSDGVATEENVDVFLMVFYSRLSTEHDSNMEWGQEVIKKMEVLGVKLTVSYVADYFDNATTYETEPENIELVSVNGRTSEEFL